MAENTPNDKKEKSELQVNSNTTIGSVYSQVVSVTVTDTDITLEFVYVNPRSNRGEVISRVTLPRIAGEGLAKAITNTIKSHEEKKKVKKDE